MDILKKNLHAELLALQCVQSPFKDLIVRLFHFNYFLIAQFFVMISFSACKFPLVLMHYELLILQPH